MVLPYRLKKCILTPIHAFISVIKEGWSMPKLLLIFFGIIFIINPSLATTVTPPNILTYRQTFNNISLRLPIGYTAIAPSTTEDITTYTFYKATNPEKPSSIIRIYIFHKETKSNAKQLINAFLKGLKRTHIVFKREPFQIQQLAKQSFTKINWHNHNTAGSVYGHVNAKGMTLITVQTKGAQSQEDLHYADVSLQTLSLQNQ